MESKVIGQYPCSVSSDERIHRIMSDGTTQCVWTDKNTVISQWSISDSERIKAKKYESEQKNSEQIEKVSEQFIKVIDKGMIAIEIMFDSAIMSKMKHGLEVVTELEQTLDKVEEVVKSSMVLSGNRETREDLYKALIKVAATAVKAIEDLDLYPKS